MRSWLELALVGALVVGCDSGGGDGDGAGSSSTGATSGEGGSESDDGGGSDGSDGAEDGDDAGDDDAPVVCDSPLTRCGNDCVDLQSDVDNCGVCGVSCVVPNAEAECAAGTCALAVCDLGWADCDGTITTGCEMVDECQGGAACASACGSTGALDCGDPCTPVCLAPAEACNYADDDCDGECDEGEIEGCRVGVHIAEDPVLGQVLLTDEAEAAELGVTISETNAFYLYVEAGAGTQPLHRCWDGSDYAYSAEYNCKTHGGVDRSLGFLSPEEQCGATQLWRLTMADQIRVEYDASALDALVAAGWTIDPTFTYYVWPSP